MNMQFIRPLPMPEDLKAEHPIQETTRAVKARRDREIQAIFDGTDSRLLLVIGPCSADNEEAVLEYLRRLRRVQDQVSDKL